MTSHLGIPWCSKYEGIIMWKIWRNISKIWRIMKEYVKIGWNMKKIWRNKWRIWRIWHAHIYMGLGIWKNFEHRLHIVSGTWKNFKLRLNIGLYRLWDLEISTPEPLPRLWDLEKFWALPLYRLWDLKKRWASPSFDYSLLAVPSVARCEVSLFCLLHISSKLFLLTYSNKPQKCECLGGELPQTRAVSTQHVSS